MFTDGNENKDINHHEEVSVDYLDFIRESLKKYDREFRLEDNFIQWGDGQNTQAIDWICSQVSSPDGDERIKRLVETYPDMGIMLDEEEGWSIFPVDLSGILDSNGWRHVLVHRGFVTGGAGTFDNVEQLENTGFWGSLDGSTYFSPIDSMEVVPNFVDDEETKARQKVVLYIDVGKLAKARLIWSDPELLYENVGPDKKVQMNAFYVVGGIPAEAIIHVSKELDQNLF